MISLAPYNNIFHSTNLPDEVTLEDHLYGFDQRLDNKLLAHIDNSATKQNKRIQVSYHQILETGIVDRYKNLDIKFKLSSRIKQLLWQSFVNYSTHPDLSYKNFVCSFNGSDHVSRKLLTAILKRFGHYHPDYCSKNFVFTIDKLDGHIRDYVADQDNFYRKFFIDDTSKEFFDTVNSFGHVQYNHKQNIYNLESKLTQSFLHIVSETMATSYVPFVTEKFLYSVVTRGLFLTYAQPGWHHHVEKYYGFKKYTKLFDYQFDAIQNPVERLVELMAVISKFSKLSSHDWHDLYLIEQDTIEYNYDHYFSGKYLEQLSRLEI